MQNELLAGELRGIPAVKRGPAAWRHAAECPECRAALRRSEQLSAALGGLSAPPLPNTFDQGLQTKLAQVRSQRHGLAALRWPLARIAVAQPRAALGWGAGMAAALVGGALLLQPQREAPRPSLAAFPHVQITASIPAMTSSLPTADDDAFVAVCSSRHAQYASAQSLGDPSASTLAASLDETAAASQRAGSADDLQVD